MTREQFKQRIEKGLIVLDGATGTELIKRGMPEGVCPEKWCLENPEAIGDVQLKYKEAGSNLIYAPTFGGNRFKLEEFGLARECGEINRELARNAKQKLGDTLVFGDIAPTGKFIEPFGDVPFEEAVACFQEQGTALKEGGVDGFIIETMMDIQETRAAVLAVRDLGDLPVMVTMTFDETAHTLNGTDPISALVTLQALGIDAFGCNCSTGPSDMLKIIDLLKPYAKIPLIAKPNAGQPKLKNGVTVFDMAPEEFGSFGPAFIKAGVNIMGGCCGTTPDHIAALASKTSGTATKTPQVDTISAVTSARKTVFLGPQYPFAVIGERINPTGKKALQAELREHKLSLVKQFALEQEQRGASILDVNMGLSGINEKTMMLDVVRSISRMSALPLCIDTTKPDIVEAALRLYPGRALVNSISGEKDRLEKTLPAAAKYGAMFIALPLHDEGIPATAAERQVVLERIIEKARQYGYSVDDMVIDGLVMTISSNPEAARETLDLIEWSSKELRCNTTLGLSNVSFGMPQRKWINSTFLAMAMGRGLTTAIANPSSELTMNMVFSGNAITGKDKRFGAYIDRFSQATDAKTDSAKPTLSPEDAVFEAVVRGNEDAIPAAIEKALEAGAAPRSLVDDRLIPAINLVGEKFDKKEYFLPQLISCADTMRKGFEVLQPHLEEEGGDAASGKGPKVILATVQGDIHDIGKNIVSLMLNNYNFEVIDLGKDVSAEDIIDAAVTHKADIVGLSALMTTTMVEMKTVLDLAREKNLTNIRFMVGGAVIDQNYSDEIGADGYARDAMEAVRLAQRFTK